MRRRRPRVVLVGDIGGASGLHVGDEAMFAADLELVQRLMPSVDCTAISADPDHTAATYGIPAVPGLHADADSARERRGAGTPPAVRAAAKADLLVVTGGGNLNSLFPAMIGQRLELARATTRNGGATVLLGQMLGPALTPADANRVRELLDLACFVGVRDAASARIARRLGVDATTIVEQLDDAWALEASPPVPFPVDLDAPFVAVTLHPDPRVVLPTAIVRLTDQLARVAGHCGAAIVLVPHCRAPEGPGGRSDEDVSTALARALTDRRVPASSLAVMDPREVAAVTRAADLVISSRYHPLVFAQGGAVPAVGLWASPYVHAKQAGSLRHVGLERWVLPLDEAIDGHLETAATETWDRRAELRAWVAELDPMLRGRMTARDAGLSARLRALDLPVVDLPFVGAAAGPEGEQVPSGAPAPTGGWDTSSAAPLARPVPDPLLAEFFELREYARALEIDRDATRSRLASDGDEPAHTTSTRTTTVLDRMRLEIDVDRVALVGRVSAPDVDDVDVRYRVYGPGVGAQVDTSATAFLPVMTFLAARLGTDLVIDAPVDAVALENAERATAMLYDWWGWRPPRIDGAATMPERPRARGTALWFSRGVDSTHTLLRALAGELVEDGERIALTHLLGLDWIDPPYVVRSMPQIWSDTKEAAASLGLPLVRFTTDVRGALEPFVDWKRSHGAVLSGLGNLLGPVLGSVLISGTGRSGTATEFGCRPELDRLWSTSATSVIHAGADRTRLEKVAVVAQDQSALDRLKVCWQADTPRNCGRCAKCLATMTELELAGALAKCDRFDGTLSPDAVHRLARSGHPIAVDRAHVLELVDAFAPDGNELRAAWQECAQVQRLEQ